MDGAIEAVLGTYHEMIREEGEAPRREAPGGRDGGQDRRMRAVGPQTGRFLNILARSQRTPLILEIGTSFGYSGVWLAEAARAVGGRIVTMELHGYKSDFARDMIDRAGLADQVEFRVGDAVHMIDDMPHGIDFVLLDLWKDLYVPCLEAFYPKLNPGAIVVADNIRADRPAVMDYVRAVRAKPDMTSVMLPVGDGILVSRFQEEKLENGHGDGGGRHRT